MANGSFAIFFALSRYALLLLKNPINSPYQLAPVQGSCVLKQRLLTTQKDLLQAKPIEIFLLQADATQPIHST
jgi:hypothetical protein